MAVLAVLKFFTCSDITTVLPKVGMHGLSVEVPAQDAMGSSRFSGGAVTHIVVKVHVGCHGVTADGQLHASLCHWDGVANLHCRTDPVEADLDLLQQLAMVHMLICNQLAALNGVQCDGRKRCQVMNHQHQLMVLSGASQECRLPGK